MPAARPGRIRQFVRDAPRIDALRARLEPARSRIPLLDAVLDELEHEADIGSGILAGALAYRLFLFFLPLAFFLLSALGLAARALDSTPRTIGKDVGLVGLVTNEVAATANRGSGVWVALGALVVLAYATRVLHRAVAVVHALAWERSAASAKLRSGSPILFGLGIAAQLALTLLVGAARAQSSIGGVFALIGYAAAMAGVWLVMSLRLPHADAQWIDLVPGSLVYGIGILAVNAFNILLLGSIHSSRTSTYGTLGTAAAVLLSLFFIGRVMVSAAVLSATLFERRGALR
jgi:uncharacterized BrkB/YihY/UPF0761 family membrane protein